MDFSSSSIILRLEASEVFIPELVDPDDDVGAGEWLLVLTVVAAAFGCVVEDEAKNLLIVPLSELAPRFDFFTRLVLVFADLTDSEEHGNATGSGVSGSFGELSAELAGTFMSSK